MTVGSYAKSEKFEERTCNSATCSQLTMLQVAPSPLAFTCGRHLIGRTNLVSRDPDTSAGGSLRSGLANDSGSSHEKRKLDQVW